ncbi:MAG: hypothetical protein AB1861_24920 [Cyanobacteriota bacterium]
MTYFNQLHPWCLMRRVPKLQSLVVARFRRRCDAEAHQRVLQRLGSSESYNIVFDVTAKSADVTT